MEKEGELGNYFVKKKKKKKNRYYIRDSIHKWQPRVGIMFHYIAGSATNPPIGNPCG